MRFWFSVSVIAGAALVAVLALLTVNVTNGPTGSTSPYTTSPKNTAANDTSVTITSSITSQSSASANNTSIYPPPRSNVTSEAVPSPNFRASVLNASTGYKVIPDFNVAAVGDWDCNFHTRETISNIEDKHPEVVLALGDMSYSSNFACWEKEIKPLRPVMHIVVGNHDGGTSDKPTAISALPALLKHFHLAHQYYSFNYQNVHFTVISTELPIGIGTEQYKFVEKDLASANTNSSLTWKIVLVHKPGYASPGAHEPDKELRDSMHPLFDKYDVDLVLQGHNHNYQRTLPIKYDALRPDSPIITTEEKAEYINYIGEIWIIDGTGGAAQYKLTSQLPYVIEQFTGEYGFMNLDFAENGKLLIGNFYGNDGRILDSFAVTK